MIIVVKVARTPRFCWQDEVIRRLAAAGHSVSVEAETEPLPWPSSVMLLLQLESVVRKRQKRAIFAAPGDRTVGAAPTRSGSDLCLNLAGVAGDGREVHVLYDGHIDPVAAVDALLDGRTPRLDLVQAGRVIETAWPATENPGFLAAGLASVFARVADLYCRSVARLAAGDTRLNPSSDRSTASPRRALHRRAAAFSLAALSSKARETLLRRLRNAEVWQVGLRRVAGPGIVEAGQITPSGFRWLRDDGARYFADPFLIRHGAKTWMFMEEYPFATGKGVISACEVMPDGRFGPTRVVLETADHLSYPYVFERDGAVWMLPESSGGNDLALYRATEFPWRWTRDRVLLGGISLADATPFEHEGRTWIFAATTGMRGASSWDALSLFHAADMDGDFVPHPLNPVLIDVEAARPAGRVVRRDGAVLRLAQNCRDGYGSAITVATIDRLDPVDYHQTTVARIRPPAAWAASGLHTITASEGFEAIDLLTALRMPDEGAPVPIN